MSSVLDIDQILNNQIISAKLTEQVLKDLEAEAEAKLLDIQGVTDEASLIQSKFEEVSKERDELRQQIATIQTENDLIKTKFAKLLDQF